MTQPQTVLPGLQSAVSGVIARLLTNLMVTQMLENVHLLLTVQNGHPPAPSGGIVKRMREVLEEIGRSRVEERKAKYQLLEIQGVARNQEEKVQV